MAVSPQAVLARCCRKALSMQQPRIVAIAASVPQASSSHTPYTSSHLRGSAASSLPRHMHTTRPPRSSLPQFTDPSSSYSSSMGESSAALGTRSYEPDPEAVTSHLNALLEGLEPPISSELAMRMVTHKGAISPNAPAHQAQHNARLSFLGRRILRLYLSIFYHAHAKLLASASSPPELISSDRLDADLEAILESYSLGRNIAPRWELENNMRWRQMIGRDGRPTGLHKISGQAIEAILGGVFRQYGAAVALQVFNSRILPFLPLPQELRNPALQLARLHGDLSASLRSTMQPDNHASSLPSTSAPSAPADAI